jgi:DNA-binding NtrC family response regulator
MSALVLIAESDPDLRAWIANLVAQAGRRPLEVPDARAALAALEQERPDVVVLGRVLSDASERSLLELVLSRAPGLPALVVSDDSSVAAGVAAMKMGASDFLVIPCAADLLASAVERALRLSRTRRRIAETVARQGSYAVVGGSVAMGRVRETIDHVAKSETTTVLLEGETGTGKEVVAHAIHAGSARAAKPFLKVNCAALPEALLESELFGHEKGAFTTALGRQAGVIEAAQGGTVLLDEMGDLPSSGQAKLLRLLEGKTFRRVGGVEELRADVRVIAATHANLESRVSRGRFRSDLFFRLNVVRVELPPLRNRREDIAELAAWFVANFNERTGRSVRGISSRALEILEGHSWPGNVRELRNVVERAFTLYPWMEELRPEYISFATSVEACGRIPAGLALPEAERWVLENAMRHTNGNQVHAARLLGISRFTLRYRLRKHGLRAVGPAGDHAA